MIYLDNASTTPILPEVIDEITNTLKNNWFNPSGLYHGSKESHNKMESARTIIANKIGANKEEIVFTSSGSESNNLAINGFLKNNEDYYYLYDPTSHSSVNNIKDIKHKGNILVDQKGKVDLINLKQQCKELKSNHSRSKPFLSLLGANNEIGTIQDIKKISKLIHSYNGVLHVDAVQLFPNQKINVKELGIDMMTISAHKIGMASGIAALYVKKGISLSPIIFGEQENGLRGGTENLPYIMGFAKAVELLNYSDNKQIKLLRDYAIDRLSTLPNSCLVGSKKHRLANNINMCFKNVDSQGLIYYLALHGVCSSSGSACNSFSYKPSHVLKAIGMNDNNALSCIRFTLNKNNTHKEIDELYSYIFNYINMLNKR